jgi:hypothetical protein
MCVLCAVNQVCLLTGKRSPRRVCCVCREASQPAHGTERTRPETICPGTSKLACWRVQQSTASKVGRRGAGIATTNIEASLLAGDISYRRGVFSSCREPGKLARGIQAWSRVLLVCREPPRKLTAKRHLCREPDVWFTAAERLTAALRFPVVVLH